MSDYTVKRFPLIAEFQRIIDMFCEFEADIIDASVRETAGGYRPHLSVKALLDGDEEVRIEITVEGKEVEE